MLKATKGRVRYYSIILAGFLIMGFGLGLFFNCTSAFLTPVSDSLGFSRGKFTLYNTISLLISTVMLPYFGRLFEKFGLRKVMLAGTVMCSLVPVGYSFSTQLWQFYVIGGINGLFINCITILATGTLINSWFKDKKGIATAIAFSGSGLVSSIMINLLTGVIENMGWRIGYRVMAAIGFGVLMPVILFIVKDRPEDVGLGKYSEAGGTEAEHGIQAEGELSGLTRGEALRTPALWLVMTALFSLVFVFMGISNHTISYLRDLGYSAVKASAVQSGYLLALVFTKILIGIVADKAGPFKAALFSGVFSVLMPIIALFAYMPRILWVYVICMSLAASAGTVLPPLLTEKYFGQKDFSAIYGLLSMAGTMGSALSAPVAGFIFDMSGSYNPAFYMGIVVAVIGVLAHMGAYKKRCVI